MEQNWMSSKDMAAHLGVSMVTFRKLVADGLPHITLGNVTKRFNPEEVIKYLRGSVDLESRT